MEVLLNCFGQVRLPLTSPDSWDRCPTREANNTERFAALPHPTYMYMYVAGLLALVL